jgi:MFS family permease
VRWRERFAGAGRHRNFRIVFAGQVFAITGTWMQTFATTWLVLRLTDSATAVGVLVLCQFLPFTLFGLFAGAAVDALDPHRTVVATQALLAACAAALALLTLAGWVRMWEIYALAALGGGVSVIDFPARQALVLQLVGRAGLSTAVALNASLFSTGRIVGPALGGIGVSIGGVGTCLLASALAYLPALAGLAAVRRRDLFPIARADERIGVLRGTADAIGFAARTRTLRILLAVVLLVSVFSANVNVLVPLLAAHTLAGGAATFGALSACLGLGSIAGGLLTASRGRASVALALAGAAGMGIAELLIAPQATVAAIALLLFALGIAYTVCTTNVSASLQVRSPEPLQRRAGGL